MSISTDKHLVFLSVRDKISLSLQDYAYERKMRMNKSRHLRANAAFGMEPCGTRAVGTAVPGTLLWVPALYHGLGQSSAMHHAVGNKCFQRVKRPPDGFHCFPLFLSTANHLCLPVLVCNAAFISRHTPVLGYFSSCKKFGTCIVSLASNWFWRERWQLKWKCVNSVLAVGRVRNLSVFVRISKCDAPRFQSKFFWSY